MEQKIPEISGTLRKFMLKVPEIIDTCSGIKLFGKVIKSIVFTTDICIIRNVNADAVIAVYPFTPQPIITQAVMLAADRPVFCGVGGGVTQGKRVVNLALHAEFQGAVGVVLNAPTQNDVVRMVQETVDIPIVVTIVNDKDDIGARIEAGCSILNVSAAGQTAEVVRQIRTEYPDIPIIATGGPTEASISATIAAGANAITWTPPSNGEVFKDIMDAYRKGQPHP
ncbi:MAG: hydrolase [Clostridiales bacterium]|nr:hydrolase [Clostridiales bacterium]